MPNNGLRDPLAYAVNGLAWTMESVREYEAAFPDQATNWGEVHTVEILVYLGGPFAGQSCVNSHEGGFCEYCHRTSHTTDEHRTLFPNAMYV